MRMAGYAHHVFLSYRRGDSWETWVERLFAPTLGELLALHIPGPISIFVDRQLDIGMRWAAERNKALDTSRVMVPVLLTSYFGSIECRQELARMLHREQVLGLRTANHPWGLVLPARLSGRTYFPERIKQIQDYDFTQFAIPSLSRNTAHGERFEESMSRFALDVADAVLRAPPYDPAWALLDGGAFLDELPPKRPKILEPPRLIA